MKLLLCSDFSEVGYKFLDKFFGNTNSLDCLFVGYATEDENELESGSAMRLKEKGINLIPLTKDYDFSDTLEMIFVRGGNTTRLVHLLREYGQYEKLEMLIRTQNILYIGSSAGAILACPDTEWTLPSEPYEYDLKELYGENALKGFGLVDKLIFPHASKYRICYSSERKNENDIFRTIDNECYPAYKKDRRKFKKDEYIKLANNDALIVNGDHKEILTYNWNHLPIKIIKRRKKS